MKKARWDEVLSGKITITFDKSATKSILKLFDINVKKGFLVDKEDEPIKDPFGDSIKLKEFGGFANHKFLKRDTFSLLKYIKEGII